ncbi:MAG: hypothetical protein GY804_00430 [Alphaproteobacteria bacterium]|nr:hypothetical protein [Alphaproteobacteria bacterium]
MREIEFRIWDSRREKYLKPDDIRINCGNGHLHGYHSNGNVPEWESEQFTGLTDKNGKKIFEGDIVKWISSRGEEIKATVKFSNNSGAFNAYPTHKKNMSYQLSIMANLTMHSEPCEIIGNIHE